jgi:tetratricopeptide (TPR) repeat protein
VAVAVVVVGAGIGYYYHQSKAIPGDTPVAGTAGGTVSAASQAVVVAAASMAGAASSAVPGGIAPSDAGIRQDRMDGESKLKQGDSSGAESASNQAAAKEMIKVAIAKMSEGKLDEAEKDLDDALARDPKQALGYYNMAILRLKEGRQDDALKQFEASFMNGFTYFDEMDKDPDLDGIRQDPRFTELVKQYRTPSK